MRMTIITDSDGAIIATMRGSSSQETLSTRTIPTVGVLPLLGENLQEIEIPDELLKIESVGEFHKAIRQHLSC